MSVNKIFNDFEGNLNDKVKFFIEYFKMQSDNYLNNSEKFYVLSPHMLIQLIIEELTANRNNRNLMFFQSEMGIFLKNDYVLKNNFDFRIKEILKNVVANYDYTLQVCNNLYNDIKDGKYATLICERLYEILFNERGIVDTKEEIKYIVNILIIELAIYGYSAKKINEIINEIFSKYTMYNDIIYTQFPLPSKIEKQGVDKKRDFINDLSIEDRIKYIENYFKKKKEKLLFVTSLKGLKGKYLNIHINNVHIYNYKMFPQFELEEGKYKNIFNYEEFNNNEIHCLVSIECIDKINGIKIVEKQINNAFDIIHCYHNLECKLDINYSYFIVLNKNREIISESISKEHDKLFNQEVKALTFDYNDINKVEKIYKNYSKFISNNNNNNNEVKALQKSVRYFRKARETEILEDKLLNYWICIENLFQLEYKLPENILDKNEREYKYNKIVSILPYMFIRDNIINTYWELYFYFRNKYDTLNFPDKLIEKCQFKKYRNISLLKFIDCLDEIKEFVKNEFDKELLEQFIIMLNDVNIAQQYINKYIIEIKHKLLLIYRLRNMIVHNAEYDITFIEYYSKQAEKIISNILRMIIELYIKYNGENSLQEIIIKQYINQRQLQEDLKKVSILSWIKEMK